MLTVSYTALLHIHKCVEIIPAQHATSNVSVLGARKKWVRSLQIKWQENFSPGISVALMWRYSKDSSTDSAHQRIWSRVCFTSQRIHPFASLLSLLSKCCINVQHTRLSVSVLPLCEAFVSHAQAPMRISLRRISFNRALRGNSDNGPQSLSTLHYHTIEYTVDMNCPKTKMRKTLFEKSFAFRHRIYIVCAHVSIFCSFRSQKK